MLFLLCTSLIFADGENGHIVNYPKRVSIDSELRLYSLKSGVYKPSSGEAGISFLLYTPKNKTLKKVPLLLFLPGSGEVGMDLSKQFRQRTIFEMVCNEHFQKKHPCYLLVLSPPDGTTSLLGGLPNQPSAIQQLMIDALMGIATSCNKPKVDMGRIYSTGLSYGGNGVYALSFRFPKLFAAAVPVASIIVDSEPIPENLSTSFWHLYNEGDYNSNRIDKNRLSSFGDRIRALGNDFRVGSFPDSGHNAWDKAWREEALWNWVFSKKISNSLNRGKTNDYDAKTRSRSNQSVSFESICTSSIDAIDEAHLPAYGADGLDATTFISKTPRKAGEWWQIEFFIPQSGTITIKTGNIKDGSGALKQGIVEVSPDGKIWRNAGTFSRKNGQCVIKQYHPIKYLRVISGAAVPLVVRECTIVP